MIRITELTSSSVVCKKFIDFKYKDDGKISYEKTDIGEIYKGVFTLRNFSSLKELLESHKTIKNNQAYMYRLFDYENLGSSVSFTTSDNKSNSPNYYDDYITREGKYFEIPKENIVFFGDYDEKVNPLTNKELYQKLIEMIPGLDGVEIGFCNSSSSYIYWNKEEVKGLAGRHFYFIVDKKDTYQKLCDYLGGLHYASHPQFCHLLLSKNNAALNRNNYIDISVLGNSRVDYIHPPILPENVEKHHLYDVEYIGNTGQIFNHVFPDIKKAAIPEITEEVYNKLVKRLENPPTFQQILKSNRGILDWDITLYNIDKSPITPNQIFEGGLDRLKILDPVRPDKGQKAMVFLHKGGLHIFSHLNNSHYYLNKPEGKQGEKRFEYIFDEYIKQGSLDLDSGNSFIIAPTGSGKTTYVSNFTGKAILVVPTQAILEQQIKSNKSFVASYQKTNYNLTISKDTDKYITTLSSIKYLLSKLKEAEVNIKEFVLFIDEAHVLREEIHIHAMRFLGSIVNSVKNIHFISATRVGNCVPGFFQLDVHNITIQKNIPKSIEIVDEGISRNQKYKKILEIIKNESYSNILILLNSKGKQLDKLLSVLDINKIQNSVFNSSTKKNGAYTRVLDTGLFTTRVNICTSLFREGVNIQNKGKVAVISLGSFDNVDLAQFCARYRQPSSLELFIFREFKEFKSRLSNFEDIVSFIYSKWSSVQEIFNIQCKNKRDVRLGRLISDPDNKLIHTFNDDSGYGQVSINYPELNYRCNYIQKIAKLKDRYLFTKGMQQYGFVVSNSNFINDQELKEDRLKEQQLFLTLNREEYHKRLRDEIVRTDDKDLKYLVKKEKFADYFHHIEFLIVSKYSEKAKRMILSFSKELLINMKTNSSILREYDSNVNTPNNNVVRDIQNFISKITISENPIYLEDLHKIFFHIYKKNSVHFDYIVINNKARRQEFIEFMKRYCVFKNVVDIKNVYNTSRDGYLIVGGSYQNYLKNNS